MSFAPNQEHVAPWFIDRDDGTIIHLFVSGFVASDGKMCPIAHIAFEQNTTLGECDSFDDGGLETVPSNPGCPSGSVRKNRLEFEDPLPDDFAFVSGSISRFDDRLSLLLEEWTPSRVGEPTILAGQQNLPTKTFITRYDFVNVEIIGTSDGTPNQTLTVSGSEILTPTKGTPIVLVEGVRFTVVDDLTAFGPNDNVFQYDSAIGEVLFGDGINGAIPKDEAQVTLKITIRDGGGQWEFVEIVLDPRDDAINIGNVKTVEDKIFYSEAKIAVASQSGFLSVITDLNGIRRRTFDRTIDDPPPRSLLSDESLFGFEFGGEMNAVAGLITLHNTLGFGYVNPLPTAVLPPTNGIFRFSRLEVDTSVVYPSAKATTETFIPTVEQAKLGFPGGVFIRDFVDSGVITSPKNYDDTVSISPVVLVRYLLAGPPFDDDTIASLTFETNLPTSKPIVAPNYDIRLIRMGHVIGTFDDPVDVEDDFGLPVFIGGDGNHDNGQTLVTAGAYKTVVPFSLGDLSDELIIQYECRLTDERKALLTHYDSPIPPDFTCTWTVDLTTIATYTFPDDIVS